MNHFYETIDGWFDFQELYAAAVQFAEPGAHFVEVGAWLGRSTAFMAVEIANSNKAIRFDVVDTWDGTPGDEKQARVIQERGNIYHDFLENMKPVPWINPIKMESTKASRLYADGSLDFIFIDGDHSLRALRADLRAWYRKCKIGGVIAGHDWPLVEVQEAVQRFFQFANLERITIIDDNCWCYRK